MILNNQTKISKKRAVARLFYFFLCFSIMGIHQSNAQDRITLKGQITNATNEAPVSDANIIILNVNNGTSSDINGNYTLGGIKNGDIIEVSKLGFKTVTYEIKSPRKNQKWDLTMSEDILSLSEVVVTNFGGSSKQNAKLQSSVAITTINNKEIDERVPRNNADVLKAIPGFWVESAGGDGPASVWVRGFPQSGGYAFLGILEDGLPVFQTGYNSLPSPDQFYKIDESLLKIEAIRGGSAPIISQGATGGVINHITKTGSQIFKGVLKATYNPLTNLKRTDINLGGPISKSMTYNVGGFYRNETGIYDYDYTANRGGQFRGNIEKKFNKFKIKVSTKFLDDNVNWNLTAPYKFNKNGDVGEVQGFDLRKDGTGTNNIDTVYEYALPLGDPNNPEKKDLKDGFDTKLLSFGLEMNWDIAKNWVLRNKTRYDDITHNNNSDAITRIDPLDPSGTYTYSDGTPITNNATLNGNGLEARTFIFSVDNDYEQLINRLELSNSNKKNSFTFGTELYNYKIKTSQYSVVYRKEVTNAPRRLIKTDDPLHPFFPNGILSSAFLTPENFNDADGTENTLSFYVDNKWNISDKVRLDIGARLDQKSVSGKNSVKDGQSIVFTGAPGFFKTGAFTEFEDDRSSLATTLGLNFKVNNNGAFFSRTAFAGSSIKIGDYVTDIADIQTLKDTKSNRVFQTELGYKYRGDKTGLFASLIYATVEDAISPIVVPTVNGLLLFQSVFQSTRTVSAELEAQYKPSDKLLFKLIGTIQDSEYTDLTFVPPVGALAPEPSYDWSGNKAERTPNLALDLYTRYTIKKLILSGDVRYYGDRWSTPANNVKLKGYTEVNFGLKYIFNNRLDLSMQAANLFDTLALVEGDSRGDQFVDPDTANGQIRLGKRNLPRTVFFKLTYNFGL